MSRSVWAVNIIKKMVPRKFYRSKLMENPGVVRWVEKKLFEGDDLVCLPKDQVIKVDTAIEEPDSAALPSQVAEYFVENASFRWIMNFCICRDGLGCKDFPTDKGCVFLGEAARGINPELGREVTKEEALDHLKHCRDLGLVHFVGKSKLDTVWLKIGPGDKLFTICSCCPCCCITRGVPYSPKVLSDKISRIPGISVTVTDECEGCGACVNTCFTEAIQLQGDRAVIGELCKGCGRCGETCPNDAIEFSIENENYVKEAIDRLSQIVDIT